MDQVTVVIPNFNGKAYLQGCLDSLRKQTIKGFQIIVVDNYSQDGSVTFVSTNYPEIKIIKLDENYGFCKAVNEGIKASKTPYVILLNNDTVVDAMFVETLIEGMERSPKVFSGQAKMLQMKNPSKMDDGGDYYNALGWAFAVGKGKEETKYQKEKHIFSSCGGAAIYRRELFDKIGFFDENHFAYLEDMDIGYRARIYGYENCFFPTSIVYHVGSGTSGSRYNQFKIYYSARNNLYLIYKNMPLLQIVLNAPFLLLGFSIKLLFFISKRYGKEYVKGLRAGYQLCKSKEGKKNKVKNPWKYVDHYVKIQIALWINIVRKLIHS